jgi:hypothetical protein
MAMIYCYFERENVYFNPQICKFVSFYQFNPIFNNKNVLKMTSWETCFKAYKISNIQWLLGASSPRPPAWNSVAPPPKYNSWIRPWVHWFFLKSVTCRPLDLDKYHKLSVILTLFSFACRYSFDIWYIALPYQVIDQALIWFRSIDFSDVMTLGLRNISWIVSFLHICSPQPTFPSGIVTNQNCFVMVELFSTKSYRR